MCVLAARACFALKSDKGGMHGDDHMHNTIVVQTRQQYNQLLRACITMGLCLRLFILHAACPTANIVCNERTRLWGSVFGTKACKSMQGLATGTTRLVDGVCRCWALAPRALVPQVASSHASWAQLCVVCWCILGVCSSAAMAVALHERACHMHTNANRMLLLACPIVWVVVGSGWSE